MIDRRALAAATLVLGVTAALLAPGGASASATPRGVHVAFGDDPTSTATVVWFTHGATDPGTVVEYGMAGTLDRSVTGVAHAAPGTGYPSGTVLVHEASLTGLPADTEIDYRVGSASAWSETRSFRTAPAEPGPFRFVAYGDQDTGSNARATTAAALGADPAFVLVAGDLSYAQPGNPTFPEWPKWDVWFDEIEDLASTRAFMVAPGNHECETIGCTQSYRSRFALPGEEIFYSFDYGNAHFLIFLSDRGTWQAERRLGEALAFAEQDLRAAAERKADGEIDWIIVVQHHPLYGSQRGDIVVDELIERKLNPPLIALEEAMLHANDVDVLIAGHNHNYERSKPIVYGRPTTDATTGYVDPTGFVQVITGGAGRGLASMEPPLAVGAWQAAQARRYHYTEFTIDGKTLSFRAVATDGDAGPLLDTFTLTRT